MRPIAACFLALPLMAQPRLLLGPSDFSRINELAANAKWAADARSAIIRAAGNWPASHLSRFGLKDLALPPEGGQWTLWYVCPVHGNGLQYTAPNTHTCPVDRKTYSGWPYDQVVYAWRHSELANAARDNALSYGLTGERKYAEAAAWILKQYAATYLSYALHDTNNKQTQSAARASAQTLDESAWLLPLVWAYDLLSGSDVLSDSDRSDIENKLLRAAVSVIQRYDAGTSNWQSWHNAAIGGAGFVLNDPRLIDAAINGKSGFRFQMGNSVMNEGLWYEGAWGYHFFALDPLVQLADMAGHNGYDLWSSAALRSMFRAPLNLTFADGSLPAFNDSGTLNLFNEAWLYEHAWASTGDPALAAVAAQRTRGRDALLFGRPDLPDASASPLLPGVFPDSGYAVLRAPSGDHAVILKFGPHGGWHGHYDKLGFISYANGGILGLDPGTQSYAAPSHDTWDKVSVAHNTMVVDEATQAAATGNLLWSDLKPEYSAARADAGPVYANARLQRTLLVTSEYAVDVSSAAATDGRPHTFDWVYHNPGVVNTDLPLDAFAGFNGKNGYQHLTANRAAISRQDWQLTFDGSVQSKRPYGSVYASSEQVSGTFEATREQSYGGRWSGKLSYNFRGAGYLLFSTPLLSGQPPAVPSGLRMAVYGDASGNVLTLRLNDASDQRFSIRYGPIDWQGWRIVEVRDPSTWSHFLGNNDGVIALPVRTVTMQLDHPSDAAPGGAIFVDDIAVLYPDDQAQVIADFEAPARSLRVWMLGAENTTIVSGNGLGPDLTKPVPYVLARRLGTAAEFVTLLEPFGDQPGIVSFSRDPGGGVVVRGANFEDRFTFGADGVVGYQRMPR